MRTLVSGPCVCHYAYITTSTQEDIASVLRGQTEGPIPPLFFFTTLNIDSVSAPEEGWLSPHRLVTGHLNYSPTSRQRN